MEIPLSWERLLWSGRPSLPFLGRERYFLTDLRLVRVTGAHTDELILHDIGEIHRTQSGLERALGVSTLHVLARGGRSDPLVVRHVRRGQSLAALLELLAGEPSATLDAQAVRAAMAWNPSTPTKGLTEALVAFGLMVVAVGGIAVGLHGRSPAPGTYGPDDPIEPNGHRRTRDEIVRYMELEIMPWARATLGPLKGGPDRITCETCHGVDAVARGWQMPAVAALPQPDLVDRGWEQYGGRMDAQMRNAIYGYLADSDNQARAAYMRETVMPGMARLLRRAPYDFTKTYEYNRSRLAFGCYHCHRISERL